MAEPKNLGNLALELPPGVTEADYRRLLNERMLLIGEELAKLRQPKPLEITKDLDLQGHRLVNVGDPDKKVNSKGVSKAVTSEVKGEAQQLTNALTVQFGDARYLRRRHDSSASADGGDGGPGAGGGGGGVVRRVLITLPSVREDDVGMYATLKEGLEDTSDDVKVKVTLTLESHLGDSFEVGDYFLIADEGPAGGRPQYECCRILRITRPVRDDPSAAYYWTISRRPASNDPGEFDQVRGGAQAYFGSQRTAHVADSRVYKLWMKQEPYSVIDRQGTPSFVGKHYKNGVITIDALKFGPPDPKLVALELAIEQMIVDGESPTEEQLTELDGLRLIEHDRAMFADIDWSHRCVVGAVVEITKDTGGVDKTTRSLIPDGTEPRRDQPRPGLRTHSGASYTLVRSGTLAVGDRTRVRIHVAEWPALRSVYGYFGLSPQGESSFGGAASKTGAIVDVFFVAPIGSGGDTTDGRRLASVIERLTWGTDENYSFARSDPPDGHFMPYAKWGGPPFWPTTAIFGRSAVGDLVLNPEPGGDPGDSQILRQDGYLDFVVRQVGSDRAGADLVVTILL